MPIRNQYLVYRYYYHIFIVRRQYEDTLSELSLNEFFLSEDRIATIIQTGESYDLLRELSVSKPTAKELATQFPQWSWRSKQVA